MISFVRRRVLAIILSALLGIVLLIVGWWATARYGRPIGLSIGALGVVMLLIPLALTLLLLRGAATGRSDDDPTRVCRRCGYEMIGLPQKRCPECGALTGFTRSAEELGIDEHEIRS